METNPYAPPKMEHGEPLSGDLRRSAKLKARELAADGAAVGSITKRIVKMGVPQSYAEELAMKAVRSRVGHQLLQGAGIVAIGLGVTAIGITFTRGVPAVAILFVLPTGLIAILVGMIRVFTTPDPPAP